MATHGDLAQQFRAPERHGQQGELACWSTCARCCKAKQLGRPLRSASRPASVPRPRARALHYFRLTVVTHHQTLFLEVTLTRALFSSLLYRVGGQVCNIVEYVRFLWYVQYGSSNECPNRSFRFYISSAHQRLASCAPIRARARDHCRSSLGLWPSLLET